MLEDRGGLSADDRDAGQELYRVSHATGASKIAKPPSSSKNIPLTIYEAAELWAGGDPGFDWGDERGLSKQDIVETRQGKIVALLGIASTNGEIECDPKSLLPAKVSAFFREELRRYYLDNERNYRPYFLFRSETEKFYRYGGYDLRNPNKRDEKKFLAFAKKLFGEKGRGPTWDEGEAFANSIALSREWGRTQMRNLPPKLKNERGSKLNTRRRSR